MSIFKLSAPKTMRLFCLEMHQISPAAIYTVFQKGSHHTFGNNFLIS